MVTHCCSTHAIPLSNSPTTAPHLHTSFATLPLTAFHLSLTLPPISHSPPPLASPLAHSSPFLSPPRPLAPSPPPRTGTKKECHPQGSTLHIFCDVVP